MTCKMAEYILGCESQKSRSQGHKKIKCSFSNFSVVDHLIFLKIDWSIALDKEMTQYRLWEPVLKVKVTNVGGVIIGESVVRHFLCYFSTNVCKTWLVYRQYLVHYYCKLLDHYAKCQGHSDI